MVAIDLTTTLSTKGQVIVPKAVREQLGWAAGTRLSVEHTPEGVLLKPLTTVFPATRPDDVFGCLIYAGPARTIEEMNAGVVQEAGRRHARGRY